MELTVDWKVITNSRAVAGKAETISKDVKAQRKVSRFIGAQNIGIELLRATKKTMPMRNAIK